MREGWKLEKLGSVCKIEKKKHQNGALPYVGLEDIESWTGKFLGSVNPVGVKSSTFQFDSKHILYGRLRPYLNKVIMPNFKGHCSSEIFPLRVKPHLEKRFLFHWITSQKVVEEINRTCTGTRMPRANLKEVMEFPIWVPPFPEQKRIVAILDEAFAGIERAVANTEKNLANAWELVESYTDSIFFQRGDDWIEKPLSEYSISVSTGPFGSLLHKSDYVSDGVPLVNPINIVGSEIVPDPKKLVSLKTRERLKAYLLRNGDLVIARRGEVGRCAVVDGEQNGWVCGTGCFFIRPKPGITPRFLEIMIKSQNYRAELERQATGATMKNLSNKALSNLRVSMPEEFVQNAIVNQFDELNEQWRNLVSIYQRKLDALFELKQSLLQKAFSGELTADPDRALKEAAA